VDPHGAPRSSRSPVAYPQVEHDWDAPRYPLNSRTGYAAGLYGALAAAVVIPLRGVHKLEVGRIFLVAGCAAGSPLEIWASGHNGGRHEAHGDEASRETAMAA
jgi:hypothetical protein